MPFNAVNHAVPVLSDQLTRFFAHTTREVQWRLLERLLLAHAPSGGANLLGGIGDDIASLADELGLRDRVIPYLGSTGNTAIWLGAEKPADLVIVAHMDRASFRVKSVEGGILYPLCANRFPLGEYRVAAKAVRFERGRLVVCADGMLVSNRDGKQDTLHMDVKRGKLSWYDTVLMDVSPACDGDTVIGTGLDNSLGVLICLLAAAALRPLETLLQSRGRRCLFVFTDQEEGPADGFFGYGASRMAYVLPQPTYGCVVVDTHTSGPKLDPVMGQGICLSAVSQWGRGSIVPPNYQALAADLMTGLNGVRPHTIQVNNSYHSRSDDMALGRWTRILALSGPPMVNPHTGQESARLRDVESGVWWLSYFLIAAMNLAQTLVPRYALGR